MIKGEHVVLRHVEERDLDTVTRGLNDVRARGDYLNTAMRPPAQLRARFAEEGTPAAKSESLLITVDEDVVIGLISHFETDPRFSEREIGFFVFDMNARGRGYAREVSRLMVDYVFAGFACQRLRTHVHPDNAPSVRVAVAMGFQKEGRLRQLMLVNGRFADMDVYGLLRDEWLAGRGVGDARGLDLRDRS